MIILGWDCYYKGHEPGVVIDKADLLELGGQEGLSEEEAFEPRPEGREGK